MSDVLVLCYHALSPSWPAELSVTPDAFERQMRQLASSGWEATTFEEAVMRPRAKRTLAVTFDDAFDSVMELARPILSALRWPATLFVPTGFPSEHRPLEWPGVSHWSTTEHAAELACMSWDAIGELADSGWEIGSHTRSHPRLPTLSDADLCEELEGAAEDLRQRLGQPCRTVAYPYGAVDGRVERAAAAAGHVAGAALPRTLADRRLLCWPRVGIYNADGDLRFRMKVIAPMRRWRASRLWPMR